MKKIILNGFYLFFPLIIGGIVSFLIKDSIDYNVLVKPILAPSSWLFPVMWSIIYFLLGLSYFLYKRRCEDFSLTDVVYYVQLFVNALWSIIFFLFKWRFFAIIWILLLVILLITLLDLFKKENKFSYYLNIPYLLWTIFATYLTIGIYILN